MDNKDELIAKLKRENAYLKSLLEQNGKEEIRLDREACLKLFEDYIKTNPQNY